MNGHKSLLITKLYMKRELHEKLFNDLSESDALSEYNFSFLN